MLFELEIDSKTETLHMSGEMQYAIHANIYVTFGGESWEQDTPVKLPVGLRLPKDLWDGVTVGDVMPFPWSGDFIPTRPPLAAA